MSLLDRCRHAVDARVVAALNAVADTFVPADGELPPASALGVAETIVELVRAEVTDAERRQLWALLAAWDSPALTALGGGGFRRFSQLPQAERERVLLSWCDSRVPRRRTAFQALRKAAVPLSYILPAGSGPNPRWASIGYPGPFGREHAASAPAKAIVPVPISGEAVLDCDVCIVGSGAGGGTAAGVLAGAGVDVVVMEAGDYYDDADFDGAELEGFGRLYLGKAVVASDDQGVGLFAGACLGGGTVVNFSTSFRTPPAIMEEWSAFGADVGSPEYDKSLDAVCERLGVNTDHSRPAAREHLMLRGLEALGWHSGVIARNVRGCDQGQACGYCGFGCPLGAKQSTAKTWLADAYANGARILVRTRADRVLVGAGRATGVEGRTADGHRVTVRARKVLVAAGAVHTPALLRRSGLENPNIGRHLRLHPVAGVGATFEEEVRPWEGTMQAVYSDQFADLHAGYGVKYESAPLHPSIFALYSPWRGARASAALMRDLAHVVPIAVILRDRAGGEVRVDRAGRPVVRYRLTDEDVGHMRTGVEGAARMMEAAGARTVFSSHATGPSFEPGRRGTLASFMADADACGWRAGQCVMTSFHIQGSCRVGGSRGTAACNPDGETWEVRDLYVVDGSTFPSAVGVNPMITIEAMAHLAASKLADALSG